VTAPSAVKVEGLRLARLDLSRTSDPNVTERLQSLIRRGAVPDATVREGARAIVDEVRAGGSNAVRAANARFGGGLADGRLVLDRGELLVARDALQRGVRSALDASIVNIRRFAETQRPITTRTTITEGVEIERRWAPLATVGCYVPGGTAAYPSSLLMTVVPASVAGVGTIVVASPADGAGKLDPVLLGAAGLLEVDVFLVAGGAQAIAALALGLPDAGVPAVDRVVGPGNAWATAAKIELAGEVGIDVPAGPSEGMVLADGGADPVTVAADLITQAEHGPDSPAILVTTEAWLADAVEAEVARQLLGLARRDILEVSLQNHGAVVLAPSLDAAIAFINNYAPEHLSVDVGPLEDTVSRLRNAGSLFVGPWAPESAGDYATGANHVLPTGGLARAASALSVESYGKFVQVQRITRDGLAGLRETITTLAEAEGLTAHRDAVEARFRALPGGAERSEAAAERRSVPPIGLSGPAAEPGAPVAYAWEPTSEAIAAEYGIPVEDIARFDLNTSPAPPAMAARLLASGEFETPMSEYPPSDYRRLTEAAAARYGVGPAEILVGAGADEILDIVAKAMLPVGGAAVIPTPTYSLYHVLTAQRGARSIAVPRLADRDWAIDLPAVRRAAREAELVWLCNPNNPTGRAEPDGAIQSLLEDIARDARDDGRLPPAVVLDEAYAEFSGASLVGLRIGYPRLIVVRTVSKAYALAGLRVGFALAVPATIAGLSPYRPPGSVSTVSMSIVTEVLRDDEALRTNLPRVERERGRLSEALAGLGWRVQPSVTNFLLVDFGSADEAGEVAERLLRRGLVPRRFDAGHPLAAYLRLTVRDVEQNDRLIAAAWELGRS
jgi:histidinol dehydrogenase